MQLKHVNAIDYGIIALYLGLVVFMGLYLARYNKKTEDYFKAGGRVPWLVAGLSNFVSGFSAFMFVAAAGFTYKNGLAALMIFTSAFWAYWLGYFVYGVRWRRSRISSPMEFLTRRYSPSTTYYYSLIQILPQIIGLGQGIYILCIFVSTALGFNTLTFDVLGIPLTGFQLSMLTVGVVMIVYTVAGGFWAAVLSDNIQFLIIMTMSIFVFPLAFVHLGGDQGFLGGVRKLVSDSPEGYFNLLAAGQRPSFFIAYFLNVLMGYNVSWQIAQRYYSVPDEGDTRKMAVLCSVLSLVGPLLWILPTMAARQIFPNIRQMWPQFSDPTEASFVSLAMLLLPHGMIGVVVSAILSATMGQANDAFNWLAATLTKDIYAPIRQRFTRRKPTEREQLFFGKLTMLLVGILGIAVAFYIPRLGGAFQFALEYYSLFGAAFAMPVMLGLVYTKTPWWSGMAASVAALSTALALKIFHVADDFSYERNTFSEMAVVSAVFFLSRFFANRRVEDRQRLQRLEQDLKTPAYADAARVEGGPFSAYGLVGKLAMVLGGVLWVVSALPWSRSGRFVNWGAGLFLMALGAALVYTTRRKAARRPTVKSQPQG